MKQINYIFKQKIDKISKGKKKKTLKLMFGLVLDYKNRNEKFLKNIFIFLFG